MTKQEFIKKVSLKTQLNEREAGKAVDAFLEVVTDTLKARDSINFTGFRKFSAAERATSSSAPSAPPCCFPAPAA